MKLLPREKNKGYKNKSNGKKTDNLSDIEKRLERLETILKVTEK